MTLALATALFQPLHAASPTALQATPDPNCLTGECAPLISIVEWDKREAYKLTNGTAEAVIVPSLGRVMRFGLVGGPNLLYVGQNVQPKKGEWGNYGGDKTWPAPQDDWALFQKSGGWPPPHQWDGAPHQAEVMSGGKLRTTSEIAPELGARVVRTYGFDAVSGEFVIEQAIEKFSGPTRRISIWSVTQINHPDAIFLPIKADSAYRNGFHFIGREAEKPVNWTAISPTLLRVAPSVQGTFKLGSDAPNIAIAAVKGDLAFVQRAASDSAQRPDGALTAGFGMELYNNAGPAYNEMEILSPLRVFSGSKDGKSVGTRWTYTVRWSLFRLPDTNADSAQTADYIAQIFAAKTPASST